MARWQVHRSDANAAPIVAAWLTVGASVEPLGRPCDYAVGFRGLTYLAEIKTQKGKLRPSQEAFIRRWRGHLAIIRSVEDGLIMLGFTQTQIAALRQVV